MAVFSRASAITGFTPSSASVKLPITITSPPLVLVKAAQDVVPMKGCMAQRSTITLRSLRGKLTL
jgi:hypothetical protein